MPLKDPEKAHKNIREAINLCGQNIAMHPRMLAIVEVAGNRQRLIVTGTWSRPIGVLVW